MKTFLLQRGIIDREGLPYTIKANYWKAGIRDIIGRTDGLTRSAILEVYKV